MGLLQKLDPRLGLAAAVGWSAVAVILPMVLATAWLAASQTEERVRADRQRLLTQYAVQIRQSFANDLAMRRAMLQAVALRFSSIDPDDIDFRRETFESIRSRFPEFSWLGVTDTRERVRAAVDGLLEGVDMSARPWFAEGRSALYTGDVHPALLLEELLPGAPDGSPLHFIDIAVPVSDVAGRNVGVLGAHLAWDWLYRRRLELVETLGSRHPVELVLAAENGEVLIGPAPLVGETLPDAAGLREARRYLAGEAVTGEIAELGLDWTIVVRQARDLALAPAREARRQVFVSVLLAGLLAALMAVWATRRPLRRLGALAGQALELRGGRRTSLVDVGGRDEVGRIGTLLAETVSDLQHEKEALVRLNVELDACVVERTARIERLAEEARHAAITRERLRIARDLHDMLAHSLMALLTQVRMIRKVHVERHADATRVTVLARTDARVR